MKRKNFDASLYFSVALLWFGIGYQTALYLSPPVGQAPPTYFIRVDLTPSPAKPPVGRQLPHAKPQKKKWSLLKEKSAANINEFRQLIKQHTGKGSWWRDVLKVLILLATLFVASIMLALVLAFLSCALACNGVNASFALLLFLGGSAVVCLGVVLVIRALFGSHPSKLIPNKARMR